MMAALVIFIMFAHRYNTVWSTNFNASAYNNEFDEDGAEKHKDVADFGKHMHMERYGRIFKRP